jgi:hypothetical protein
MKLSNEKTELERKLEKARDGYASLTEDSRPFAFAERSLGRDEVTTRFQQGLQLFAEVRRIQDEQKLAVEKLQQALPGMRQFHGEAMRVARKHFGADAKTMATFGAKSPERVERRRGEGRSACGSEVITEVVEEVIVEKEVVTCEAQAPKPECPPKRRPECPPKRGCLPSRGLKHPVKRGCEEAKGCGGKVTKQGR